MSKYIMRLDDACEKRDVEKWDAIEALLDAYEIKPLVGVIPHCEDVQMEKYPIDVDFWNRVQQWRKKGWTIALHGYNHVYSTQCGGINPVQQRSEFAGEPLYVQQEKIRKGLSVMREHGIEPKIFFAPSHTFDENTLEALKSESNIRIISDTIARKPYQENGFTFIPQQSGRVRNLPFVVTTFCYHPNTLSDEGFLVLRSFLEKNGKNFICIDENMTANKKRGIIDMLLQKIYYLRH